MVYTYPDYYDRFHCVAGSCEETCCSGWQIVIDDASLEKYRDFQGEYKDTLHHNIDWAEESFKQDSTGRCAFLNRENLCEMYIHMGENSFCKTCREYPRHTEEFENLREISLSLSCPEVARIFLEHRDLVTFLSKEDEEEEMYEDFDYFLFDELCEMREEMVTILQNRELPIEKRIAKVLSMGITVQELYDEGNLIQWREVCEEADPLKVPGAAEVSDQAEIPGAADKYELLREQFSYLYELEHLDPNWKQVLRESEEQLFSKGGTYFWEKKAEFEKWWMDSNLMPLDIFAEQIAVYFLTTYFAGAVYDERIDGKVEACVAHTTMLYLLAMAGWLTENRKFDLDKLRKLVYHYSREIEHSDENLENAEEFDWFNRYED